MSATPLTLTLATAGPRPVFTAETMTRSGAAKRKARSARAVGVANPVAAPPAGERDALAFESDEFDALDHEVDQFDHEPDQSDQDLDDADGFDDFDPRDQDHEPEFRVDHDHVDADPELDDDDHYFELPAAEQEVLRNELQDRLSAYLVSGRARVVITDNLRTMMSIKRGHGVYTFRLHHMFIDAAPTILRAVASYAERQDRDASDTLRQYIDTNEDAIRQRRAPRPCTVDVEGRHHNLQTIFDELNDGYFGGAIQARITWGPRSHRKRGRNSIKLGSYTVEDALIRVHPVLDAQDVPRYYLAWVIYHEMLHEIHDMPIVDGRRMYHTRAFRQAEAKFEQYPEAVLWERTNLHKLLDR